MRRRRRGTAEVPTPHRSPSWPYTGQAATERSRAAQLIRRDADPVPRNGHGVYKRVARDSGESARGTHVRVVQRAVAAAIEPATWTRTSIKEVVVVNVCNVDVGETG